MTSYIWGTDVRVVVLVVAVTAELEGTSSKSQTCGDWNRFGELSISSCQYNPDLIHGSVPTLGGSRFGPKGMDASVVQFFVGRASCSPPASSLHRWPSSPFSCGGSRGGAISTAPHPGAPIFPTGAFIPLASGCRRAHTSIARWSR